jgi:hypothetical protein
MGGAARARPCDGGALGLSFGRMSALTNLRWALVGTLGKSLLWVWAKTASDRGLRRRGGLPALASRERKPVILLVWHGRIFLAPISSGTAASCPSSARAGTARS